MGQSVGLCGRRSVGRLIGVWVGASVSRRVPWPSGPACHPVWDVDVVIRLVGRSIGQPVSRSVARSVGWSVGRWIGQSVGRSVSQPVGGLVGGAVGRLVGRSVGRLVHRSVSRSLGRSSLLLRHSARRIARCCKDRLPQTVRFASLATDHLLLIVFHGPFTTDPAPARPSVGSPRVPLLGSDPFLPNRPPRMGIFVGLRATF